MAESTLSVQHSELASAVARHLSFSTRTYASLTADEAAEVDEIVNRGYRQFISPPPLKENQPPHVWSFMKPTTTLTTSAPYSTGTIGIASGVVTLSTAGTFPSWAADGNLTVSSVTYTVNTRDGDNQVTLDDTSVTVTAGASYTLDRPDMTLPDSFVGIEGDLTYQQESGKGPVQVVGENRLRQLRRTARIATGYPSHAAVRTVPLDATAGDRWEIMLWPSPDAAYILEYRYWVAVAKIDATNKYPLGGLLHGETILASCLEVAESVKERDSRNSARPMRDRWLQRLAASILLDRQAVAQDVFGYNGDSSDQVVHARPYRDFNVTYNNQLYQT